MKKRCQKCGQEFEPFEPYHTTCRECFRAQPKVMKSFDGPAPQGRGAGGAPGPALDVLLLDGYFDNEGNLRREIYMDVPRQLANLFSGDNKPMGTKQLRDFHLKFLRARNRAFQRGIGEVRPDLYRIVTELNYQVKRGVVPKSFLTFVEHHTKLAEKDEQSLNAFFEHINSVVCYYPKIQ
jgi:CRISPR/Cas system CSM-associated protein Csm2 small subunit